MERLFIIIYNQYNLFFHLRHIRHRIVYKTNRYNFIIFIMIQRNIIILELMNKFSVTMKQLILSEWHSCNSLKAQIIYDSH